MLGEAYLLAGAIDKADGVVREALEASSGIQFLICVGLSKHLLGRIAKAQGAFPDAERQLNEAVRIFITLGARFEHGRAELDLAVLAYAQGNREAVATHLERAHGLFQILQIPSYVQRAEELANEFGALLPETPVR